MDAGGDDESDDAQDKGEFGDRLRDRWHGDSSDFPENPLQEFEGSGMATAASASGSLRGSGQVDGSWDMHGILHDDKWDSLVGSALDAFTEATSSEGSSNGMIVLRDAGTSDDGTSEWGWAIDYISDGNASDEAGLGGSVSTELSPTDDGLMRMEFVDPWAELTTEADGDAQTQFRLEIDQRYVEDLSETQTLSEPSWLAAVTSGGRAGDSELVFHYAESANYQGDGLSELLGIDVKPTAQADLEWRGTQADYIRIESSDYFNRQYDEYDMEEAHVRDTYGRNSEGFLLELANLITTDGDLAGALTYSLVSDSEEEEDEVWEADASWTGDADETAEGRVKYHSTLDSTGHERMRSETGDWITLYDGQEDREATFERIATAARAFDAETGEMIAGEFTWTGDAHVQLFGTDLSETEWTPNELEEALNTIFSQDPIGFAAGDANLYRYVGNQATTLTDPSGLEPPVDDLPWAEENIRLPLKNFVDDYFANPLRGFLDRNLREPVNRYVESKRPIIEGFRSGGRDGGHVIGNVITMGLDDRVAQCADDAWHRAEESGDYLTQAGFYGGTAGGYATQMLVMPAPGGGGGLQVGVQPGGGLGVHVAWRNATGAMHAGGTKPAWLFLTKEGRRYASIQGLSFWQKMTPQGLTSAGAANFMAENGTRIITLPALNPRLATMMGEGRWVGSCVTSGWNAWSRSNYHLPNIWVVSQGYDYFFGDDNRDQE